MKPKIVIHNHFRKPTRDSKFSPGQKVKYKGMAAEVEGPGPSEGMVKIRLAKSPKSIVGSEDYL
jgi:hypothetical protein